MRGTTMKQVMHKAIASVMRDGLLWRTMLFIFIITNAMVLLMRYVVLVRIAADHQLKELLFSTIGGALYFLMFVLMGSVYRRVKRVRIATSTYVCIGVLCSAWIVSCIVEVVTFVSEK